MSNSDLLYIINTFPINQRFELIKSILDGINNEKNIKIETDSKSARGKDLHEFAGIWDEKTANDFHDSIEDCRKIDFNEW